jgi:hypothetical protein
LDKKEIKKDKVIRAEVKQETRQGASDKTRRKAQESRGKKREKRQGSKEARTGQEQGKAKEDKTIQDQTRQEVDLY